MNVLVEFVMALGEGDHPECTILGLWNVRKWQLVKTLRRLEWDLERVVTLAGVLGDNIARHPQIASLEEAAAEQRAQLLRLDRFLTGLAANPTGILRSQEISVRICAVWLDLERTIRPEERRMLADLRNRLVLRADRKRSTFGDWGSDVLIAGIAR